MFSGLFVRGSSCKPERNCLRLQWVLHCEDALSLQQYVSLDPGKDRSLPKKQIEVPQSTLGGPVELASNHRTTKSHSRKTLTFQLVGLLEVWQGPARCGTPWFWSCHTCYQSGCGRKIFFEKICLFVPLLRQALTALMDFYQQPHHEV